MKRRKIEPRSGPALQSVEPFLFSKTSEDCFARSLQCRVNPFYQCTNCTHSNWGLSQVDLDSVEDHRNLLQISDSALESLNEAEKDRVFGDLYGTADAIDETESFVNDKLRQMDEVLLHNSINTNRNSQATQDNANYLLALEEEQRQGTLYVRSTKLRLMFLRAECFNVEKAAARLCRFFTVKKELFGVEKLPRQIYQSDLNLADLEALFSGALFIRSGMDHCNRMAFIFRRQQFRFQSMLNLRRASFYYIMSSIEDNTEVQKQGVFSVLYAVGKLDGISPLPFKQVQMMLFMLHRCLPFRLACSHYCYNDMRARLVLGLLLRLQATINAARNQTHFGSHRHCRIEMIKYGIRVDLFPVDHKGNYELDALNRQLLKKRQKEEQQQQALSILSNSLSSLDSTCECTYGYDDDDYGSIGSY